MSENDGGPALGCMSMRDYFAAVALQGLLATDESPSRNIAANCGVAYQYADEMLKRREQQPLPHLHLYKLMHPRQVRRPTPAGQFWIPYAALVATLIWMVMA